MVTLEDIRTARERIAGGVHRTPLASATSLGDLVGTRVYLKAECLQKTGSFKVRGVLNALGSMDPDERGRGLVSISAGNHAAALAWGAACTGTHATIVMPERASPAKIEATKAYGGDVDLTDGPLLERCHELQASRGLTLVHPFDDPLVVAGQGTLGLEVLEDLPEVETVIVPIGGGGLIAGVATAIKEERPDVRIVGVEPVGANVVSRSLAAGRPVTMDDMHTIADGLAAPFCGTIPFKQIGHYVDVVVRVDDEAIARAVCLILERAKLVTEPAGAAAFAALLAGAVEPRGTVVCVLSGGNVDASVLRTILADSR